MAEEKQIILKRKVKIFDRRSIFFSVMALVLFLGAVLLMVYCNRCVVSAPGVCALSSLDRQAWSTAQYEDYANKLISKGLKHLAAQAYEDSLEASDMTAQRRAKICYRIAELYLDLAEYEKALAFLYRVEIENPKTELADKIGEKIVACLENMGLVSQARYEMEARTGLDQPKEDKGGTVIAKIDKDEITLSQIDAALEKLQPWVKQQFGSDEGKKDFVRQYVAAEVLYRKAKRLGYDKDPEMRLRIEDMIKELLVQKVMQDEISKKVKTNPSDVKLYYDANKDKYLEKPKVKLSYIKAVSKEKARELKDKLKKAEDFAQVSKSEGVAKAEQIEPWIDEKGYINGVGTSEQIWEQIAQTGKGNFTEVIESEGSHFILLVEDKKESRQKDFSEVKDQVEYEYRHQREQETAQALIESVLEEQQVQIYLEKLGSTPKNKDSDPTPAKQKE